MPFINYRRRRKKASDVPQEERYDFIPVLKKDEVDLKAKAYEDDMNKKREIMVKEVREREAKFRKSQEIVDQLYSEVDDTSDDKGEIPQKKKLDEEQMIDDK